MVPGNNAHTLFFGFRLQDSRRSTPLCDKGQCQTGRDKQASGSQGTGGEEASVATWPSLTLPPLLLSWAIVMQRLEATPEPGRTLHEGLVQYQCHLSREVGLPGCPGPALPRPLPRLPRRRRETTLSPYQDLASECVTCAHNSENPRDPVRGQL